ncbi:O-antigen ligase family protein [Ramlibacter sp. USB13]|uniref:O-antigen ligase family protein n=1 Tax=Ramlibacter cellulosilyticus TaxID=2764187 RepID=A0A923MSX8_9BURK|nr:O-antigen ligase family protein [Ramlibacter cellulosilyticus]MBC5784865.1 O-antigen ligase family protein [Ramlibacter cellulosilyticus]
MNPNELSTGRPLRDRRGIGTNLKVQNIAIAYVCLWAVSPPLGYRTEYRVAALAAVLVWFVLEIARRGNIFARPTTPVLVAGAYVIYTLSIEVILGPEAEFDWHIQPTILLFFLIVHESRRRQIETLAPVFWVTLASLPLWLALSLMGLSEYDNAARILVRSSEEAMELAEQGIGGYGLVYLMVTLLPVMVYLAATRSGRMIPGTPKIFGFLERRVPILTALTALLGVIFILRAQYSIAVYLAALSTLALMASRKRALLLVAMLLVGLMLLIEQNILFSLLDWLASLTSGSNLAKKFQDILDSLRADEAVGTLSDRTERYLRSLSLFAENPFLGVLEFRDVGKHSAYLDRFARYGFLVGGMFVYLMLYLPVRLMKQMRTGFGMAFAVFAVVLVFPALNNVFLSFGVALYIMFPVACTAVLQRSGAPAARKPYSLTATRQAGIEPFVR